MLGQAQPQALRILARRCGTPRPKGLTSLRGVGIYLVAGVTDVADLLPIRYDTRHRRSGGTGRHTGLKILLSL